MANKEFYKAEDLAKLLDVNIMTIYRYIKAGHLKIYKVGKKFSNSLPTQTSRMEAYFDRNGYDVIVLLIWFSGDVKNIWANNQV